VTTRAGKDTMPGRDDDDGITKAGAPAPPTSPAQFYLMDLAGHI
jgi:hypothetical protein